MRYIFACAALALMASQSAARAEKLLTPVKIVKEARYCGTLPALMYRERLEADKRLDTVSELRTIDMFVGGPAKCGSVVAGRYMFFDGVYRNKKTHKVRYVCLRFRPFGDCVWTRPDVIGRVFEVYPGRSLEQGNRGITCGQWAKVIGAPLKRPDGRKANLNLSMEQRADVFVKGITKDFAHFFLGTRTQAKDTRAQLCETTVHILERMGQRLTAYNACPSLGAGGQEAQARNIYNSQMKFFMECLPK